ncbi:MAG: diguanylate cyclase [Syntrophus sp. (in: bacteria)]
MQEPSKTNQELLEETAILKKRIQELEKSESDHKRAEWAELLIKKAVESSSDAIGMADPQGCHFYHNKAYIDMFEYSIEELNKPLAPIITFADYEAGRDVFKTIMNGDTWVGETTMVAKTGRRFTVFLRADAVKDDKGNIIGLIGIHTDITNRKLAEEKLNNQMTFISTLLDTIPSPIFYKDIEGKYLGCNRAYEEITGQSREEVVGKDIYDLYPSEIADLYAKKDRELYEHQGTQIYDGKFKAADGTVRDVIINKSTYADTSKNIAGVVGMFLDITARKRAEQELSEEIALKNFLLDLFKEAPALTDKDLYDYVLDYVVRLTDSTIGFFHLISDDQKNLILTAWNKEALKNCKASYATHYPLDQAGNWVDCVRLRRPVVYNEFSISPNQKGLPEGHTAVGRFISVPVLDGDKVRIILGIGNKSEEYTELDASRIQVVANDLQRIMAQRRADEEILKLSITDQLTGLHNRRGFITFADQQLKLSDRTKRGMLLFFADIDGMKLINDTLGHEEGDKALMEVAAILKETFRSVDIIARMGGDEFAILAIDSTEVNSAIFLTRLQENIDTHNHQENRKYSLSISIGCACYDPENPCPLNELMVHADKLMYEHKRIKKSSQ